MIGRIDQLKIEHRHDLNKCYSQIVLEYKVEKLKTNIVTSDSFFYLTGRVPVHKKERLLDVLADYKDELNIIFKKNEKHEGFVNFIMNNLRNRIFRPLVNWF